MANVLIIDDDEEIAELYRIVFTQKSHAVQVAIDGEEGVAKAKKFLPNIILLDTMMPKKNGMEALAELKRDPATQNIPVFVISNLVDKEIEKDMLQIGALKFLVKSDYVPGQIVTIVEEYLASKSSV